jgi:hypothetical protein
LTDQRRERAVAIVPVSLTSWSLRLLNFRAVTAQPVDVVFLQASVGTLGSGRQRPQSTDRCTRVGVDQLDPRGPIAQDLFPLELR